MTGSESAFAILIVLGALAACFFALLWIRSRDRAIDSLRDRMALEARLQAIQSSLDRADTDLAKALAASNRFRDQARDKEKQNISLRSGIAALEEEKERLAAKLDVANLKIGEKTAAFNRLEEQLEESSRQADEFRRAWEERFARIAHWEAVEDAAGKAREIKTEVAGLERTAEALRNTIEGYGSRYVLPPHSVLDDLAKEAGHKKSGQKLKVARESSRQMVRDGEAISCAERDPEKRNLIEAFVLDAFNGKIEGILEGVKTDNIGTLMQQVNDAFLLVNRQSKIFGRATVKRAYLKARLNELRWAALVQQYKKEEREEQRRIKQQMREEAKIQRELEQERRESERAAKAAVERREEIQKIRTEESEKLRRAYEKKLAAEVSRLSESERVIVVARMRTEFESRMRRQSAEYEQRIAEQDQELQKALARGQRALSNAQQVKRGHVYIISNEGSFGEGVYKIGQTRRGAFDEARKQARIDELSDASVPFDFDVHAWILSDNAPELEYKLQRLFVLNQINKMNWRKEFFRVSLSEIRRAVEEMGIMVTWTMAAEAQEYRETLKLEEQMATDPALRDRWVQEQLGHELQVLPELEEIEEGDEP